jgi:hypothetical protein
MHAKYVSTTGATLAQILADFAALLGGASIAALSASCDKPNSTLVSTVAPGWTLVDAAAANSGQVVSSSDANGLTTKYVRLFAPGANTIDLACYESWNAGTHIGVNASAASGKILSFSAGAVNTYWLFATPRGVYIAVAGATNCGLGALEISRDAAYLAGSTYPCVASVSYDALTTTTATPALSRTKRTAATGDSTGSAASTVLASCVLTGRTSTAAPAVPSGTVRDGSEVAYWEVAPIWIGVTGDVGTLPARPMILGKCYDVLEIAAAAGNQFDTFSDGVDTYMIVFVGAISALAFKVA